MLEKIYIYIFISTEGWIPCGLLEYEERGRLSTSRFRYGKKYLERENKISIDPIQLPLVDHTLEAPDGFPLFNGIRDSGPDFWGRQLLQKKFGRELNEIEYIAATGSDRVGALAFSDSLNNGPKIYSPQGFITQEENLLDLEICAGAIEDLIKAKESKRLNQYLQFGPSLGGARPKATVSWKKFPHLAKFSLPLDERNEPLLEYATMTLAGKCGLNVPSLGKTEILGRSVYLIKRFDRTNTLDPIPFISGLTITGLHEQDHAQWSYHLLVDSIIKFSSNPMGDLEELFKRMIFNIMIFNNDDHPRNFGFLQSHKGGWDLSPLYDVLPSTMHSQSFFLLMNIGAEGKKASISNALSLCERFRITKPKAMEIIGEMREFISHWSTHFKNCGVAKSQIKALKNSFSDKP
jgi:serine/threonine-protein kinase HipA